MLPAASCVVYAFGYNKQFGLEEELMFGQNCQVHIFDPKEGVEETIPVSYYKYHI